MGRAISGPALPETLSSLFNFNRIGFAFSDGRDGQYIVSGLITELPVVAAVPEPDAYALLLAGLGVLGFIARRRERGGPGRAFRIGSARWQAGQTLGWP